MITVYFDLETGGLLDDHPITQIAAVAVDNQWTEVGQFERKLHVDVRACDPEALKVNHYDPEVWEREAVTQAEGAREFQAFLNRFRCVRMVSRRTGRPYEVARLASHNAAFDGPRVKQWFAGFDRFLPAHPHVKCTYQKAVWVFEYEHVHHGRPLPPDYKLTTLMDHLGIQQILSGAHEALTDVRYAIAVSRSLEYWWRRE